MMNTPTSLDQNQLVDLYLRTNNVDVITHNPMQMGNTLKAALETAVAAYKLIPPAQTELYVLLGKENDEIHRNARQYQIQLIEQQLTRASELAQKRLTYFDKIKTQQQVVAELQKCREDINHWFEYYAWGFDPRPDSPLNTIPFSLFAFQGRFIGWLDYVTFQTRQSGVVPKSRDMGATETALRWAVYNWLFKDGFEVLLLSRTEDEVDSKNDVNTLFEKARFQLRLLPQWMLPEKFNLDKDMPYMLIKNPQNGSTFHGRAPTENVGRQLRVAVVIYDEFAFAPNAGYKQYTALSQTSKSIICISSVGGRQNKFADLMTDGKTPRFEMDWREHPWKTQDWYNALSTGVFGAVMDEQQIAQEIDRNLDASQPGKVWKFSEEYQFMTFGEVVSAFAKFGHREKFIDPHTGKYRIPYDWRWSRYQDYGQTRGHEWSYLIAAKPSEYYPYHDTVFVFLALELKPTGLTNEQAVGLWKDYEQRLGLRNYDGTFHKRPWRSKNSHEQANLRKILLEEYGEYWDAWDTDYIAGIEQLQVWFNLIETNLPNPFRPELNGRSRIIFVAPDDEYKLAFNERESSYFLTNSKTEYGYLTLRKQLSAYHYPEEERGKDVKKMRPAKQFDDIIDALRALAVDEIQSELLTPQQEIEIRLPDHLKDSEIAQHYGQEDYGMLIYARQMEERHIKAELEEKRKQELLDYHRRINNGGIRGRLLGRRRR